MAAMFGGDIEAVRSLSRRSWSSRSLRSTSEHFGRSNREEIDDEEELRWAAIERLPTYDRIRKGVLKQVLDDGSVVHREVDVTNLGEENGKELTENILKVVQEDSEQFLRRLRDRIDRVKIETPSIEVRYENLSVDGEARVGSRGLPTLFNVAINTAEGILGFVGLAPSKKTKIRILKSVSGIIKPSRMTLLLGPPSSGKTTLLLALAGKLDGDLKVSGKITYCGHELREFVPRRTSAYISQHDVHYGEMTVRETLDFSGRCLGVGTRYELISELVRREKTVGLKPDPEIDAFMKAISVAGQGTSILSDCVVKVLGLDICADTLVGDAMRRGISGGQKKRLTTGEMLVGPAKALFMDEISTGLDSSTTFQIVKYMKQTVHIMNVTMVISLLQPAPETFELFDDIILLSEGHVVYHGPRDGVLDFFQHMGFKCPERKGIADFLQEVTSKKDQEQYWFREREGYGYVTVHDFALGFQSFSVGQRMASEIKIPFDESKVHPAALVKNRYGISGRELFRACFDREWLLVKRNSFVYVFKTSQITLMSLITMSMFFRTTMHPGELASGGKYLGALFFSFVNVMFNGMAELAMTIFRLPVFFKQRDCLFFPAWAFALPIWVLRIPLSLLETAIWISITYYTIGYAPAASRFFRQFLAFFSTHHMALSLFRFIAAVGRTPVVANTLGTLTLMMVFVLGGFIIAKDDIRPWMLWGYYVSPMMYGQNAIVMNEFLDDRWSSPNRDPRFKASTVGEVILQSRSFFTDEYWYWICIGALAGFAVLFNILFIASLTYLNPFRESATVFSDEKDDKNRKSSSEIAVTGERRSTKRGMVLPFEPLSMAFNHINYYVDMK